MAFQGSGGRDYTIAVVSHALRILQTFLEEGKDDQSVKGISERLGLDRSRVYRILCTLERQGFVYQNPHTKRYRLGLKLFELGQTVARRFDLARVSDPILAELTERTGETSYVYALDGVEGVVVAKREGRQSMRITAELGRRDTLLVGAACNTLLAHLPAETIDDLIGTEPLPRWTERTITDPCLLKARLAEIRQLGYHLSRGEEQEGVDAVAAPVRASSGQVIAAVGLALPSVRFTPEKTPCFIQLICEAGQRISTEMGYLPFLA